MLERVFHLTQNQTTVRRELLAGLATFMTRGYVVVTLGSAYAKFSEDRLGTLEQGKEADLVVLSQDIFTVPHEQIGKTTVWMTMVGGKVLFKEAK